MEGWRKGRKKKEREEKKEGRKEEGRKEGGKKLDYFFPCVCGGLRPEISFLFIYNY